MHKQELDTNKMKKQSIFNIYHIQPNIQQYNHKETNFEPKESIPNQIKLNTKQPIIKNELPAILITKKNEKKQSFKQIKSKKHNKHEEINKTHLTNQITSTIVCTKS